MSVFPNGVKCMAEILVSLDRLQKILLLPEVEVEIKREADIESFIFYFYYFLSFFLFLFFSNIYQIN